MWDDYVAYIDWRVTQSRMSLFNATGSCPWPTTICGFKCSESLSYRTVFSQLTMVLRYRRQTSDTMGVLIQAIMKSTKLKTGLSGESFKTPLIFWDLMTDPWIKQLWVDCIHYGIKIFTDIMDFPVPHSSNIELMRLFVENSCWGQELVTLNQCCMALQVIWLSNICMGSGRELSKNTWEGKTDQASAYQWPLCAPTGPADWQLCHIATMPAFGPVAQITMSVGALVPGVKPVVIMKKSLIDCGTRCPVTGYSILISHDGRILDIFS